MNPARKSSSGAATQRASQLDREAPLPLDRRRYMTRPEWVLVGLMGTTLVIAVLRQALPLFLLPVVLGLTTVYFSIPVTLAGLEGLTQARRSMAADGSGSTRAAFWSVVRRRALRWLGLWVVFIILLAVILVLVWGGMVLVFTLPSVGVASLTALCALWMLRWTFHPGLIVSFSLVVPTVAFALLWSLTFLLMDSLGFGGYSGIALFFVPPMVAGGGVFAVTIWMAVGLHRRDELWYRRRSAARASVG